MIYLVHQLTSSIYHLSLIRILIWYFKLDSFYPPLYHQKERKKIHEKNSFIKFFFSSCCCCKVIILEWKDFHFALIFKRNSESPSTLYGRKSILEFFIFSHLLYFFYFILFLHRYHFLQKTFHTFCFRINFLFGVFF